MKIIYAGLQAENYDKRRKPSFEYINFFLSLRSMPGVEVVEYPFDTILTKGKATWNFGLFNLVQKEKADALFVFMYSDELEEKTMDRVRRETQTKVVGWFADDYRRFFNYSRLWAPHMDLVATTSHQAADWYKLSGFENILLAQWAANPRVFQHMDIPQDIDVSFVGQYKPARGKLISALGRAGIRVEVFGAGWPNGRVSPEKLPEIFSRSKINLNLNTPRHILDPWMLGRIFFRKSRNHIVPDWHVVRNVKAWAHTGVPHIHARVFEILACNAFLISGRTEHMDQYYKDGKEIVYFDGSAADLITKVRHYLRLPQDRERIARAGYARTMAEHTYEKRFADIFSRIGLML